MIIVEFKTLPFCGNTFSMSSKTDLFRSSLSSESVKSKTGHFEIGPFHSFWNSLQLEVVNKAGALLILAIQCHNYFLNQNHFQLMLKVDTSHHLY